MKKVIPFIFTGNSFNLRNIVVYLKNNTSKTLENDMLIFNSEKVSGKDIIDN